MWSDLPGVTEKEITWKDQRMILEKLEKSDPLSGAVLVIRRFGEAIIKCPALHVTEKFLIAEDSCIDSLLTPEIGYRELHIENIHNRENVDKIFRVYSLGDPDGHYKWTYAVVEVVGTLNLQELSSWAGASSSS